MLDTEQICPAALMRKWLHTCWTQGCTPQPQFWALLMPFTGSSQNSQNYLNEMLLIFNNCLIRATDFFYTGLYRVFGVQSITVHLFSPAGANLLSLGAFTPEGAILCTAGHCSLESAGWAGGCSQPAAGQGKQNTTTFYTSHLFEMPTICRIKSVLHASQQQ